MFDFLKEEAIKIAEIIALDEAQSRLKLDEKIIREYAENISLDGWQKFEPIIVFSPDQTIYFLGDGFHRLNAHLKTECVFINAKIFKGGEREAILYSCGANQNHGLRRSDKERENAVLKLLKDPEWSKWNDQHLAKIAKCSSTTIANIAKKHNLYRPNVRLVEKASGEIITTTTRNAGRKPNFPKQIEKSAEQLAAKAEKSGDINSYLSKYFEMLSQRLNLEIEYSFKNKSL